MNKKNKHKFVVCLNNAHCDDLDRLKIYRVLSDRLAEKDGYLRIIDESGENYLYPAGYFAPITINLKAQAIMARHGDLVRHQ
jgi:hypothetical protein